jgi:hypothetical protein
MKMDDTYLVWSHEHGAWWRPNRAGYTTSLEAAGRYTRDEAIRICGDAHDGWNGGKSAPPEIPVRLADAMECIIVQPHHRAGRAQQSKAETT